MRAQMQVQFQWLFAVIGGILFLLFFFTIINTLINSADEVQQRNINFAADVVFRASLANPETFTLTELPEPVTIQFACELAPAAPPALRTFDASHARVNSESYTPSALRYIPFFSPRQIAGDQIFTLTRTWDAPFPVTRLLMVSNNRTRYVLLTPVGWLQRAKEFVRAENLGKFSFETRSISSAGAVELASRGVDQYRFILVNADFGAFYANLDNRFKRPENTALVVTTAQDDFGSGTLQFHDDLSTGAPTGSAVNYYGKAMLDAALFAGSRELFTCNMQKAYERLYTTLATSVNRTQGLYAKAGYDASSTLTPCGAQYRILLGLFETQPFAAVSPFPPQMPNPYWRPPATREALPAYVYAVKYALAADDRFLACQNGPPGATPGCNAPSLFQEAANNEGPLAELERRNVNLLKNDCPLIY